MTELINPSSKITPVTLKTWAKLGERGTAFGIALPEIAKKKENLKLLTADLSLLSGMERFSNMNPEKFLNVGIAEQNMVGIASGLALEGYCVFASTYASFIAVRSLEFVRHNVAYLNTNVKIIGSTAGVTAAKSGISHWATEDLAFMRVLPNIKVFSPADALETYKIMYHAANVDGPMYIRLSGGLSSPQVYKDDYDFIPGKMIKLRDGKDVCIIATGFMVSESLKAAELLLEKGIEATVYNMHTIKPIDKETLSEIFAEYSLVATAEEHNVLGGMGSAVAEYRATLSPSLIKGRQIFIGMQDTFNVQNGAQAFVWEQLGMTAEKIAERILSERGKS